MLNKYEIRYVVVGGFAVAHHGYPRFTGDLDVFVESTPDNADRLVAALKHFGFGVPALKPELFRYPEKVIRMGREPVKLEILTSISGVGFSRCYPRRVKTVIEGVPVAFIGLKDLIRNKAASGRPKDIADLHYLRRIQRSKSPRK